MSKFLILALAIYFIIKDQIHTSKKTKRLEKENKDLKAARYNKIYYQGDRDNTKFID